MARSSLYAWYVIAVLSIVSLLSQFDRHFPSLLVGPLKERFSINDTQFSLLHGYAFALTYALFGIPFGRLVDRANRRNLLILGLLVWSALTVSAAFAQSYMQLLITRMGVGIGEAVLAPAAYSLIADYFAPERRGRAMAIYFVSLTAGSALAMIGGGAILGALPDNGIDFAVIGHLQTWQAMFLLAGLPGGLIMWLLLTVREPARQEIGNAQVSATFGDFLRFIRARAGVFARIIGSGALFSIVGAGVLGWAPALFDRRFGLPPSQSAYFIGGMMLAGGIVGPLFAGWLSDRLTQRKADGARIRPLVTGAALLVLTTGWSLAPTISLATIVLGGLIFAMGMINVSIPIILQHLTPNGMRGQAIAVYMLVVSLVGAGFGPMAVGLLSDFVFRSEAMLHWSLLTMALPAAVTGAWLSWKAMEPYKLLRACLERPDEAADATFDHEQRPA